MSTWDEEFSQHRLDLAREFGLPEGWEVAIDKFKTPFGRRVVVEVSNPKGRRMKDTVVGSQLTKRDLDRHAARLVSQLASELGFQK